MPLSLDGIICATISGIFQHTAQNNLYWVTNWKIQQTGLLEDNWVEGTRSFGSWWWWTEGKTRKKEVIWKGMFKKFSSQLSTPEGRKELRPAPVLGVQGRSCHKKTNHKGGTWTMPGTSSSVLGQMGSREFTDTNTAQRPQYKALVPLYLSWKHCWEWWTFLPIPQALALANVLCGNHQMTLRLWFLSQMQFGLTFSLIQQLLRQFEIFWQLNA